MPPTFFFHDIFLPLAGMAMTLVIAITLIKTVARGLERRHEARMAELGGGESEGLRSEVGQLRSQVESLEERLDFAERMLTQERSRRQEALPRGEA